MNINGFNKLTLLDYPEHIAATIFIGGCNMRCPFCHNASLVTKVGTQPVISKEKVFGSLWKRRNILEGVCITGGEPTLYPELYDFIKLIKALGFKVKLDTNGTNPKMLKTLLDENLLDYVAMDIKNSRTKYKETSNAINLCIDLIDESIKMLLSSSINYEFRTTIIKEFHTIQDMISIGEWIRGAKAYYLQSYEESEDVITKGNHQHTKETLEEFKTVLSSYVDYISLRGVY